MYDPVDVLTNAILGQESNWNPDAKTSVTGARGISQIQPSTWAQYAYPGEDINNATDNAAVGRRIIADYYKKYGFDPGRIATAYFSGPNNVSAAGSAIPYREDRADPTGKRTSGYVRDINSRVSKLAETQPVSANDILSSFEQSNVNTSADKNAVSGDDLVNQFRSVSQPETAGSIYKQINGSLVPIPQTSPAQIAAEKARVAATKEQGKPNWLLENYHPLASIPQTVGGGVAQLSQGLKDIRAGNPATGTGNLFGGLLNTVLGPLIGPYNETFRMVGQAIGNPQAADVMSLLAPTRGVGGTVKAALPASRASSGLIDLIGRQNIPNVLNKLEANPNLSLMDVSEPVRTVAAGLANSPETPAAQTIMRGAYDARTSARQDIVQKAVENKLGPNINVKDYLDQLKENVKKVGKERIDPAIEGSAPIGVMPLVDRLDQVIKAPGTADETISRLSKLKDQLTAEAGNDGFIDPQKLHGIQWRLRAEAENLSKSASGSDRNLANPLFEARKDMVNAIDAASGGKYKPALAGFRDENQVQDAFDKGFDIFKSGGVQDFPEFFNDWVANAQPAERVAAKVGAITAIRRQIEGFRGGASRGENLTGVTFNREKLSSLFGEKQAAELGGLLEDAKAMNETNSLLYRNSKTAQVSAGQKYFQPREVGAPAGTAGGVGAGMLGALLMAGGQETPGLLGLGLGGLKLAHSGAQYVGRIADKATATNFARLASAGHGPTRNELIGILRSAQQQRPGINQIVPSMLRLAAP